VTIQKKESEDKGEKGKKDIEDAISKVIIFLENNPSRLNQLKTQFEKTDSGKTGAINAITFQSILNQFNIGLSPPQST